MHQELAELQVQQDFSSLPKHVLKQILTMIPKLSKAMWKLLEIIAALGNCLDQRATTVKQQSTLSGDQCDFG